MLYVSHVCHQHLSEKSTVTFARMKNTAWHFADSTTLCNKTKYSGAPIILVRCHSRQNTHKKTTILIIQDLDWVNVRTHIIILRRSFAKNKRSHLKCTHCLCENIIVAAIYTSCQYQSTWSVYWEWADATVDCYSLIRFSVFVKQ